MIIMMNNVFLVGRMTKDIELRYTQTNKAYGTFTIAINRPYTGQDGKREADFINIVVWGNIAENTKKFTSKGSLVGIEGRIQTRTYEASDGKKRTITEVLASSINFIERKQAQEESKVDKQNDPFKEFGDKINNGLPEEENVPW